MFLRAFECWVESGGVKVAKVRVLQRVQQLAVGGLERDAEPGKKISAAALRCDGAIAMLENWNSGGSYNERAG
jgi:hypothetical protein